MIRLTPSRLLVLLVFVLSMGLTGCSATRHPATWVVDEVPVTTDTILWDVTRLSMQKAGFNVMNDVDPVERTATSGWRQDLAPFRRRGFREQAIVRYVPQDGYYDVEVRVRRELNMDIVKPLDPTYADWETDDDNEGRARVIVQYIKAYLGTRMEVGERPSHFRDSPDG